jgi:hypothetical protein
LYDERDIIIIAIAGLFVFDEESQLFWFNRDSFESKMEFELIGILFGLAIYNSVILDVRFPLVLYRKLLSKGKVSYTMADLNLFNVELYRGMKQLLDFDGTSHSSVTTVASIY